VKTSNRGDYNFKLESKPLHVVLNPDKPILYVTPAEHGGALVFEPEHDRLLKLNSTGIEIWKLLSNGKNETEVIQTMADLYKVDTALVARDLQELVRKISEHGLRADSYLVTEYTDAADRATMPPSALGYTPHDQRHCKPKRSLILRALLGLALFDTILSLCSFRTLCSLVESWPVKHWMTNGIDLTEEICAAVDRACVWYPRKALCLQRSAVTACLLRSNGVAARLVIGARPMPFLAHAWVEADDAVVNDFPRVRQFYGTLVRF
jgi:hypothetical protein